MHQFFWKSINLKVPYLIAPFNTPLEKEIFMMTLSNGNIFRVTGPLCGEFTGPVEFPAQRLE